ncbi:hypothetical protein [Pedobacter insulae]|uniref:Uncharacterized protein n=1 Tax=Pedobacter insulae TaxID=414048 RepID=A0A1I2ZAM1_9SPHI|nr:hypothetical protein [Pedobacter insulae]SFH34893.1 hypothetical protein SAMN04489864_109113 [Pedobacter insulae]
MLMICENDHVRNLANFDVLIAKIISYGNHYKPTKGSIQLAALSLVSQNAHASIANVTLLMEQYLHSVSIRELAFETLKQVNKNLFKILRSTTTISEMEMYMLVGSGKVLHSQFASQQRYDFLLDNFCSIIKLLKTNVFYMPKEEGLKIPNLEDFYSILYLKNTEVKRNCAFLSNACIIRNEVMYREANGLVALAATVKMYVKYHYGWESTQFKQIANLVIRKAKAPIKKV